MDPFEIDQDDKHEDIYPWKNPPRGKKRVLRIKREIIKKAIGKPKK